VPPQPHSRAAQQHEEQGESARTIVIALVANVVIAIAKLIAGIVSHSTAMLAESAHSFADSLNEVLLAISVRRRRRPADAAHPLGHGREQFLWAFMAAIGSFLIGGCLSVALAIWTLRKGGETTRPGIAWAVLAVAFIADGISLLQSLRQARRQAREFNFGIWTYLRRASDPTVRAIVVEDTAALIGVIIAAIGLIVSEVTGSGAADGIASLLIGILLAITAVGLAHPLADFLVGRSLHQRDLQKLHEIVQASPAVDRIVSLRAVYSGPEEVIVAAKIHPSSKMSVDEVTRAMDALDRELRAASSLVADVFLDLTRETIEQPAARS
jgi:cation diffusion facilitator family transporter